MPLADRVAVDFITKIASVADALHDAVGHADGQAFDIHELERLGRDVRAGHAR
ncbi:hypothetical protein GALL_535660 [mine drainage metagenome]|uniref:Uncharacterized protein n=1 Tax=mine drainage metagenome TaxID=410659 RepID=A0A1J5P1D7_9ZZZZ